MRKKRVIFMTLIIMIITFVVGAYSATSVTVQDRYKLVTYKGDFFLLDSWSGRVWIMVYDKTKKENWFKELVVFDNENSIPYLRVISNVKKRIIENKNLKKKKSQKKEKWLEEITGSNKKKK